MIVVSIIVPCYKQGQYLSETLESVLAQSYKDWECIIVDDGSPDNVAEIAKEYCAQDNRFKFLHQENQGVAAARNNAISISYGEYILPLDGDDKIDSTYLEKALAQFKRHPETKVVYCRADKFGAESGEWKLRKYDHDDLWRANSLFVSSMFRRKDFDKVGGYDEHMREGLEDYDFFMSLLGPFDKVYQIDEVLFHYRIVANSRTLGARKNREKLRTQIMEKHPEYKFIVKRYYLRKSILLWPYHVYSYKMKIQYIENYGNLWRAFRRKDAWACFTYPWMVIYRKIKNFLAK